MVVIVVSWVPMVLFAIRGWGRPPARLRMAVPPEGPRHRVLVVANRGLEEEALCDEVCRRTARTATEAMIVAPVAASSPLRELSVPAGNRGERLAHLDESQLDFGLISTFCASSAFGIGIVTSSTPSLVVASMSSASTPFGVLERNPGGRWPSVIGIKPRVRGGNTRMNRGPAAHTIPSMRKTSTEAPTSKSLECPNCRRQFNGDDVAGRGRGSRCTRCGSRLVVAGRLLESEVRRQLYGGRSPVVGVMSAQGARR